MLDRHLVIGCEPLDDPFTSKASNPAVLFASEWGVRPVIHAAVLDMSHTGFHTQRKCNARALSPDTTALESPNSVSFATGVLPRLRDDLRNGTDGAKTCSIFRAMISS